MASKNAPNQIISAAGWLMQFVTLLIKGLTARGWDNDQIHALVTDNGAVTMERIVDAILDAIAPPQASLAVTPADFKECDFRLLVNLDKSLEEMMSAGKFKLAGVDRLDENTFPSVGRGLIEETARLFPVAHLTSREALQELDRNGYRPATFLELLAFGTLANKRPIDVSVIAHGSYSPCGPHHQVVPYFCDDDKGVEWSRYLHLRLLEGQGWGERDRFLAIRKKAA